MSVEILRTMIPDDASVFGDNEDEYLFRDEQLEQFLTVAKGSVLRATAYAVLAIATSEALISKVIQTQDLKTDGAKVAQALQEKANLLFRQADDEDANDSFDYIDIVPFSGWGFGRIELTENHLW